jgi:hypothetical protein
MSRIHLPFAGWLLSASLVFPTLSHAEQRPQPDADLQAIEAMLHRPEVDLDLADVKLDIDKRVEPRIDVAAMRRRLDTIVTDVLEMLPPAPTRHERFEALHAYLYRAGDWNGNRPWLRAAEDPACRDIATKLLATHLVTRRGNCVSMAMLFAIVGQRLGLDVSLATAPQRLCVYYRDDAGVVRVLEPTTGELTIEPIQPRGAIPVSALRPLTRRESVVLAAQLLLDHLSRLPAQAPRRTALAELLRLNDPRRIAAQPTAQGSAADQIARRERAR